MNIQNPNITYEWCFLEKYVCTVNGLSLFSPIYFQLYHKVLLFCKVIYFIKRRVIVTCNNYYALDSHFIKILWVQKGKAILNLKDQNFLKLKSSATV